MNAITLLFSGLTLAGLYMFGLAVKAMYLCLTNPSTSSNRKLMTILFGNVIFVLGIAVAGVALSIALQGAIGKVAHALLTFVLLLCSAFGQVKLALRNMAKSNSEKEAVAPVPADAEAPADATSEAMAEVVAATPRVEPTLDLDVHTAPLAPSASHEAAALDAATLEEDGELEAFAADQAAAASSEVATPVALAKTAPAANDPALVDDIPVDAAPAVAGDEMDDWLASQDSVPTEAQDAVSPAPVAEAEAPAVAVQQELPLPDDVVIVSEEAAPVVAAEVAAAPAEAVEPEAPAVSVPEVAVAAVSQEVPVASDVPDILADHMDIEALMADAREAESRPIAA